MITKETNDLFTALVRAKLFLPNADGVRTFARLLAQISMKQAGKPRLYGERTLVGTNTDHINKLADEVIKLKAKR